MKELHSPKSQGFRGLALIAAAIGAVAAGAFAIGPLAIGKLAIRRLSIENAEFKSLEIQDLTVSRLRAAEVTVSESLKLPGTSVDYLLKIKIILSRFERREKLLRAALSYPSQT